MNKKIFLLFPTLLIFLAIVSIWMILLPGNTVYAQQEFLRNSQKYIPFEINTDNPIQNLHYVVQNIINNISKLTTSGLSEYIYKIINFIIVCLSSSIILNILNHEEIEKIVHFSSDFILAVILYDVFGKFFSNISDAVTELWDYMNVSMPLLTSFLASSGYNITAKYMQFLFICISSVLNYTINNYIIIVLRCFGYIIIFNMIAKCNELDKFIKTLIKFLKNIINIMLILFGAIMTICGVTTGCYDNMAFKTAKAAVSTFVPIVGGCLSESLSSVIYSSNTIKNSFGLIALITIIFIAIKPAFFSAFSALTGHILSLFSSVCGYDELSDKIDTITSILSVCGSLMIFSVSVFIIVIALIISFGS